MYRFDGSDPRFTAELLHGPLDPGGGAFGGDHWTEEFNAIRTGNNLLAALPTAQTLTAEEQSATSGYVKTLQALNFLYILNFHTEDSIPIDVGTDVTAAPAAVRHQRRGVRPRHRAARSGPDRAGSRRDGVPL